MQKWEYFVATCDLGALEIGGEDHRTLIERVPLQKYLDELGDMSWELVSMTRLADNNHAVLIFKREPKNKF